MNKENIYYLVVLKDDICNKEPLFEKTTIKTKLCGKILFIKNERIGFELNGSKGTVIIPIDWIKWMAPSAILKK